MNKERYEQTEMEIIRFQTGDVIVPLPARMTKQS